MSENIITNTKSPEVEATEGQTTTEEQRQIFISNIEQQVNNLKSSSSGLKNQNNKVSFSQAVNWINSNQLVVFDIMIGLKSTDNDIIQIFEESIIKMLESVMNVLKKSKNIYLAYIISNQTAVLATSVYRFYLSHPMDSNKQQRIQKMKSQLTDIMENLFLLLEQFNKSDITINYLEQSLRLIESFGYSLPEQNFSPILNFASGFAQMVAFGGTRGWDQMMSGIKDGVTQLVNKQLHAEQLDTFVMYTTLERIKYSIIKILLDDKQQPQLQSLDSIQSSMISYADVDVDVLDDSKEKQIVETLQTIGKTVENSQKWGYKYFFVQILGELILYQSQIDANSLEKKLSKNKFPYDLDINQIWDILIKNNWVIGFKLGQDENDKIGLLSKTRNTLDSINIDQIQPKKKNKQSKKKQGKKEEQTSKNEDQLKDEFIKKLNEILEEYEPITKRISNFMLNGNAGFKGLLGYCFEGLDQSSTPKLNIIDKFSNKDPIEILEISFKNINNFALDFFSSQFTALTKMTEKQLRKLFIGLINDNIDDIIKHIFASGSKFNSIANSNQNFGLFQTFVSKFIPYGQIFTEKILEYLPKFFDSLQLIEQVTNKLQESEEFQNNINNYILNSYNNDFNEISLQLIPLIQEQKKMLDKILNQYNSDNKFTIKQSTLNKYILKLEEIQLIHKKNGLFSQLLGIQQQEIIEPQEFIHLKILNKNLQNSNEKDSNLNYYNQKIKEIFTNESINQIQQQYAESILNDLDNMEQQILQFQENIQQNKNLEINLIESKTFFYLNLINNLINQSVNFYAKIKQELEDLKTPNKSNLFTFSSQWLQNIDTNIKQFLKQNSQSNFETLKQFIQDQTAIIQSKELEEECNNSFLNKNLLTYKIFFDLQQLGSYIFLKLSDNEQQKKLKNPDQYNNMIVKLIQLLEIPINQLKIFMNQELDNIKETVMDDIQVQFKEFLNSSFSQDLAAAITGLRSISNTDTENTGGFFSSLANKYSDQNWRIREKVVLILFDLNRIYGGEDGDQTFANMLIHMKAKDTNPKVQQTLKNEEMLIEMKSILSSNWKSQENEIKEYIKTHFAELDEQVKKMKEDKSIDKDKILKYYEKKENQLNQQLENISEIGSLAGIQLEFMKDMKKQLFKLQQQVEEIKDSLKTIGSNILLLKGKSVYQLFEDRKKKIEEEEEDKKVADVQIQLRGAQFQKGKKNEVETFEFIAPDYNDNFYEYQLQIKNINQQQTPEKQDINNEKQEINKKSSLIAEYINQVITEQNPEIVQIKKKQKISEFMESRQQKFILDEFYLPQFNSLLIHGQPGSGKSRICQQIEYFFWQNRKMQKLHIYQKIKENQKLQEIFQDFSIDQLYQIMLDNNFINEKGFFTSFFIEFESELEDIKAANRIVNESWGEDEKNDEEEEETYELTDIQSESAQNLFQKKLSNMFQNYDKIFVSAIYDLLDDQFQNKPFPILTTLSNLNQPHKDLLRETLSQSPYDFDDGIIRKIRDLSQMGDIKLVFIIDGYNEMKQELQGLNLFTTNGLELLRSSKERTFTYPKVITTCRSNFLSEEDYQTYFQNIFQRKQKIPYKPDQHYLEYQIEDLNYLQIQQYFKEKFLVSLKSICMSVFEKKFNQKKIGKNQQDSIQTEFNEFWNIISFRANDAQEYNKLWMGKSFIEFIVETYQQKEQSQILNEISQDEYNKLKFDLTMVYTQAMYEKLVKKTKLNFLLNNVLMMNIFIEAMEKLMQKLNSESDIKLRIKSAIQQEDILKNYPNLSIDIIISLLSKGQENLIKNFSLSYDRSEIEQKIQKLISKNSEISSNNEFCNHLSSLICFALYSQDITRYRLYDTFYANYIKKQIKILKDSGKLMVTQGVMLKDCKLYSKRLAAAFHENDKEIFKRLDQSQLYSKKSIWDEFFDDVELPIRKQARYCLPFVCSGNIFHFMHYSIKDFIMAHEYFDTINHFKIDLELFECIAEYHILKSESQNNINEEFQDLLSQEDLKNSIIIQSKTNEDGVKLQDKALIEFVIQQTKDAMQQEMKQTLENLKLEINDLKKSFAQTQNLVIKQEVKQEKHSFIENLMNDNQELESFMQFYIKKSNKKTNSFEIKEKIQKFLDAVQKVIDQSLNKTANLYNFKNKGICDFLKDKMKMVELPDPSNQLFRNLNYLIKLGRIDQKCSNSAANAIGLMIYNNNSFNRVDFSGMDIQGINLYGGKFIKCIFNNCNMEGANLSKSVLYKCKFSNSNLNNAIFQNCIMNRSTFSQTRFNDIQLGRDLDIYYFDLLNQKDNLVHIMVDPLNSKCILAFHKQSVFRINIDQQSNVKQIKKFEKELSHKAGMIKYPIQSNQYIVGYGNNVSIIDVENFNFIDQISNLPFDIIKCIQHNDITGDILIGGINQLENKKYIIIGRFLNDFVGSTRILTEECVNVQIHQEINQIICHYLDKKLKQYLVICFNQDNYQQIGQQQILTRNQKLKKYGSLKKVNDIQQNRFLIHPSKKFENISLSLFEITQGIHEIAVEKEEEVVTREFNPNGTYTKKVTKNKALIDSIRIHVLDQKKYGKAHQILINQQYPKLIICAYKNGLIRRFQIQSLENKDQNIINEHVQIPKISFSLQMPKQHNEILSCYINNKYDSIIQLVKFHFNMNKDHSRFEDLQIIQTREFKTRSKNLLDKKDSNIKNKIIGMMTHNNLLQEFILVVLENKNKIIKFLVNRNLIQQNKIQSTSVTLSELTKEAKMFDKFSIHPENHDIFCFSFNQIDSKIPSQFVIYNLEQRQILINLAFNQVEQNFSKLYFDNGSNFQEIISYNRLGDIKIFEDIQYDQNVQNNLNVKDLSLTKKKSNLQDQFPDSLPEPNQKIFFQPKQKGKLTIILGRHPQKQNIIVAYDYLENTISKYDLSNGEINTTQVQTIKQLKKKGKSNHNNMVNFHKQVLDEILDHCKLENYDEILKNDEKKLIKIFENHVQIILHPKFPLVFLIFKEQQHMAIYSLDKNTILDFMEMAFYFDPSVQTNLINFTKNPNIFIYTYSQTIKVVKYIHNEEKQQDIFETIYQKYLQDPTFQCLQTKFKDCIMGEETKNILQQNGAIFV